MLGRPEFRITSPSNSELALFLYQGNCGPHFQQNDFSTAANNDDRALNESRPNFIAYFILWPWTATGSDVARCKKL